MCCNPANGRVGFEDGQLTKYSYKIKSMQHWSTIYLEKAIRPFKKMYFETKELLFEMLQSTNEAFDLLHNFVV